MTVSINVNDLSLAHKGSKGFAAATLPDVCKTPSPGGPVPIPYPNVAVSKDLAKGTTTVRVDGGNMAANKGSELALSTGDEPGSAGGVVSSTFKKEATWMLYSFDVMLEGKNACRLTDKLFMNHMNTVCLGGFIQEYLRKNRGKSLADACKALFEYIMDVAGIGEGKHDIRGLDGPNGRFEQNTKGGSLGPQGAPNAPRNHGHIPPNYPNGANDWETHDDEIRRQQDKLKKLLQELDDECGGGSNRQQKDLKRAREIADRQRPAKEDWEGPVWEPTPEAAPMTIAQKVLIVGGLLLIAGGLAASLFTGGGSLAASAAGVAIIAGARAPSSGPGGDGA